MRYVRRGRGGCRERLFAVQDVAEEMGGRDWLGTVTIGQSQKSKSHQGYDIVNSPSMSGCEKNPMRHDITLVNRVGTQGSQ